MNELRWILIGFGIVLLAGIYLWGRRSGAAVAEDVVLRNRPEPAMQPHSFADAHREPEEAPTYQRARLDEPASDEEPAISYDVTAVRPAPARQEKRNFRTELPVAEDESPPSSFVREASRSYSKELPTAAEPVRSNPIPDFRRSRLEP